MSDVSSQEERGRKRMRKTIIGFALSAMLFALCVSADAQQPKNGFRIGFLIAGTPSSVSSRVEAFRQGLAELGFVEW
jgi:hypothetical protein